MSGSCECSNEVRLLGEWNEPYLSNSTCPLSAYNNCMYWPLDNPVPCTNVKPAHWSQVKYIPTSLSLHLPHIHPTLLCIYKSCTCIYAHVVNYVSVYNLPYRILPWWRTLFPSGLFSRVSKCIRDMYTYIHQCAGILYTSFHVAWCVCVLCVRTLLSSLSLTQSCWMLIQFNTYTCTWPNDV